MSKKKVYGVGSYEKGKYHTKSKEYIMWAGMLRRCYDNNFHKKQPTYVGCTVCDEWLDFKTFTCWVDKYYPDDGNKYYLDKDLRIVGNTIYAPHTCMFIPSVVNTFISNSGRIRGDYLMGVSLDKRSGKLYTRCNNPFTGDSEYLGSFTNEIEAHLTWRKRKSELTYELVMKQEDEEIKLLLLRWKDMLDMNLIHTYQQKRPYYGA